MVDSEKLVKHILHLEKYIEQLKELQKVDKDEFLNNWKVYGLVDRWLHLCLETFISVGDILISELNLQKPDTYADIPKILMKNNVIDSILGEKLIDLAKFRNVLVHEYLYLDHEIVYRHLLNSPEILNQFLVEIKDYLKKNS